MPVWVVGGGMKFKRGARGRERNIRSIYSAFERVIIAVIIIIVALFVR